jgi:outer membrane autotransporter protein
LSYEPFVRITYRKTEFDAFTESSTDNSTGSPAGFEFNYRDRSTRSLDGALGAKLQYAFTRKFGVVVPYLQADYHHEFKKDPLNTVVGYDVLSGLAGAGTSSFSSDTPDSSYFGFAAGSSVVFKHGVQAFLQIQSVAGLSYIHNSVVGMGLRGEF